MPPRQKQSAVKLVGSKGGGLVLCAKARFLIWAQVLNSYLGLHITAIMLTALLNHKTHTHSHKEHTYEQTYSTTHHLPAYSFTSLSLFSSFKDLGIVWNHSLFTVWSTIFPLCHLIWVSECVICELYSVGKIFYSGTKCHESLHYFLLKCVAFSVYLFSFWWCKIYYTTLCSF